MGYYKDMFTPWDSIGSYEDDELAEFKNHYTFENGVLVPIETKPIIEPKKPFTGEPTHVRITCTKCKQSVVFKVGKGNVGFACAHLGHETVYDFFEDGYTGNVNDKVMA